MIKPVLVIPCSGIGKVFGSVSREAALKTVEELRPTSSETMCLGLLVTGDEDARERLSGRPAVTIDGCPQYCARTNVELAGGQVASSILVVDVYRQHSDLKSQSVTFLDDKGLALADWVAQAVMEAVDDVQSGKEAGNA